MIDCTLANTGLRNLAIWILALLLQALCALGLDLISGVQSHAQMRSEDRAAGLVERAANTIKAAGHEFMHDHCRRIYPLCNEHSFAVGHDHADGIGTRRCTGSEVQS